MPTQSDRRPPFLTPGGSPLRHAVEMRSAAMLLFIRSLPRAVAPLTVIALLAVGVVAEGPVSIVCLVLVLAFFCWLLFLSWPALPAQARLVRMGVLAAMVAGIAASAVR